MYHCDDDHDDDGGGGDDTGSQYLELYGRVRLSSFRINLKR